jgi:anti-sigma B factor antagonist
MSKHEAIVLPVQWVGTTAIVPLAGQIDLHQTPMVHKALVEVCEQRPVRLIIDLHDVEYMDSSGIGTLVELFRRVHGHGGELLLCGMCQRVRSVFEITKLDRFFKICTTAEEALSQ